MEVGFLKNLPIPVFDSMLLKMKREIFLDDREQDDPI